MLANAAHLPDWHEDHENAPYEQLHTTPDLRKNTLGMTWAETHGENSGLRSRTFARIANMT